MMHLKIERCFYAQVTDTLMYTFHYYNFFFVVKLRGMKEDLVETIVSVGKSTYVLRFMY